MSLASKVATLRKKKGWTQEYLADKLGVQKTQVTRWETGRSRPSMPMMKKLAPVLGVTTEQLLEQDDSPEEASQFDSEISACMKQLQELELEDRTLIFKVIDTFARQRQLAKFLQPALSKNP